MSDHSLVLGSPADPRLVAHVDLDAKLPHALDAVVGVADADVVLVDPDGEFRVRQLEALGARVTAVVDAVHVESVRGRLADPGPANVGAADLGPVKPGPAATIVAGDPRSLGLPDESADVIVGGWSAYRGVDEEELAEAERVLRPNGRLAIVHDYGRDDVSRLLDPVRPELTQWSRRGGPFLRAGFKIRVVHCWWTFDSQEAASDVLGASFGAVGRALAATLKRPRLSYNIAIYHRTRATA